MTKKTRKRIEYLEEKVKKLELHILRSICESKGGEFESEYGESECRANYKIYRVSKDKERYVFTNQEENIL